MPEGCQRIRKMHAMHRAATLSRQLSNESTQSPTSASEYMRITRSSIEREMAELKLKLDLLNSIYDMAENDMLQTAFDLLDVDNDKMIDARELADGTRSIWGEVDKDFQEYLELAVKRVASFDQDGNGQLDLAEFKDFLVSFASNTSSDYREILEMILFVLFSDKRDNNQNVALEEDVILAVQKEESYRGLLRSNQMKALFDIFDEDRDGLIDFKEFVFGIYKMTEDLQGASKAAMEAMLLFDEKETRFLDFERFTKVILNLHEVSPDNMNLADMLEVMTQAILLSGDVSMEAVFNKFSTDNVLCNIDDEREKGSDCSPLGALEYAKVFRLFQLWDLDKDSTINFTELLLGLR